jgi:sugar phosphate isomerase/epimerase
MKPEQIALQLYTVREPAQHDFLGTLRKVAAMGYGAVELAGLHGVSAAVVRQTLDELGMRAVAAHVSVPQLEADFAAVVAEMQTLGCDVVVVPWVPAELRGSVAAVQQLAANLNGWAARLRDAGLRMAYHHHDFEFVPLDGSTMWDVLTATIAPALVGLEIDVYWAARAGHDPAALIARHAPGVPLIHLKDIAHGSTADVPAGAGALDWEAILAAARAAGVEWYIVEQDNPADPLDDVRRARELMIARAQE